MRILFDQGTPSGIAEPLAGHEVTEAIERGWDRISNGELLEAGEDAGFELLLTTDRRIRHQQNLTNPKIAIVVLGNSTWRIVRLYLDRISIAANAATPGSYTELDIPFSVIHSLKKGPMLLKNSFAMARWFREADRKMSTLRPAIA